MIMNPNDKRCSQYESGQSEARIITPDLIQTSVQPDREHIQPSANPQPVLRTIPSPLVLPKLGRRQFIKLSVAAALIVSPGISLIAHQTAQAAPTVDLSHPIGKRWVKLGGYAVVGAPASAIAPTPDGAGQYQTFAHGVIIYSVDWGAMLISPAIFQKWQSLNALVNAGGQNLLSYVGFPTQDFILSPGLETGHFERGMIVVETVPAIAHVVYGAIYEHYWHVSGVLGLPTLEEMEAAGGGRYQAFQGGDIYWRGDTAAWAVYGAIKDRWLAMGGSGGPLGYPLSDEQPAKKDGLEIGRSSRFENGVIYYSGTTGAWDLTGDLRREYENRYGGPNGWLGFPVSGQGNTPSSGGVFNNFQNGVLVFHSSGTFGGVWAFNKLQFFIQRLQGDGTDCAFGICGSQDLYVHITINTSAGTSIKVRRPTRGEYDGGSDLKETFDLTPDSQVVHSNLVVDISMDAWDDDDSSDDDHLGTLQAIYSIDNLWGLFEGGSHTVSDDGSFTATFSIKNPLPFDISQFRQQAWWSFENFTTPKLTYDQFAATFTDVDTDEAAWRHPFNALYYELAYKSIADGGNCFGMSLESIFAQVNRSLYSEPIIRFWPDTQEGQELDPNNPTHQATINEVNIKQGYQLGAECVDWFLSKFITLQDHNPRQCFIDSRDAFNRGDYPVISLSSGYFKFSGHTVRPYRWDDSDPTNWVIYIADPNKPATNPSYKDDNDLVNRIEIDPLNNAFIFRHRADDIWAGTGWTGGRMFYIPFRHLNSQPRTPFWEVLALILAGTWLILGDSGQTKQITDETERTFYEPDLTSPPTRWDQIRRDDGLRVPNIARVPWSDVDDPREVPIEMYYARGYGATYKHEVLPAPDAAPGTPYEWVMHSATLSARVMIPGTPGVADLITARGLNTSTKAVTVTIPANSSNKQISWTMAGPIKQRWIELRNLRMASGQSITMRLANSGSEATFENAGPPTTADLWVQTGPGASLVLVDTITLEGGKITTFQIDSPPYHPNPNGKQ
jgi:hypothetical protein